MMNSDDPQNFDDMIRENREKTGKDDDFKKIMRYLGANSPSEIDMQVGKRVEQLCATLEEHKYEHHHIIPVHKRS